MSQTVPPFAELLARCHHSAIHLETRDTYGVSNEDEDFAAWRAGHRHSPENRDEWWNDFHSTIAEAVGRGVVEELAPSFMSEFDRELERQAAWSAAAEDRLFWGGDVVGGWYLRGARFASVQVVACSPNRIRPTIPCPMR
ncbi:MULTISPECIES: DUF6879 family protein [Streptomyces violaceusniger group]|uniref:DUF6879 domain-containing protein n=1 Tax=Streptomyces rhizosphaericus TaxID=114699 RepID=A0ABN1Q8K0_9ACTN|nr:MULTISPECIES: DUF6879 family protein [Streptomyces violaceusniger group]